jgi:hypothetical protein
VRRGAWLAACIARKTTPADNLKSADVKSGIDAYQRTTQRLHLGCQRYPALQTTGATTTGAGATTTGPPLGRQCPHALRCQPGPQPPSALALLSDMSESKTAAGAGNNFVRIKLTLLFWMLPHRPPSSHQIPEHSLDLLFMLMNRLTADASGPAGVHGWRAGAAGA